MEETIARTCRGCGEVLVPRPGSNKSHFLGLRYCTDACKPSPAERFFQKVDKNGPVPAHRPELGPCWIWTASRNNKGYGLVRLNWRLELAHRAAFCFQHGRWPEPCALHLCDHGHLACVRWDHLVEGTLTDNNRDMSAKGRNFAAMHPERTRRGPDTSPERVRAIQAAAAAGASYASIARELGLSEAGVSRIARGLRRADV